MVYIYCYSSKKNSNPHVTMETSKKDLKFPKKVSEKAQADVCVLISEGKEILAGDSEFKVLTE